MLSILVPLIMQVGIAPTASPVSALPPELRDRPTRNAPALDRPASEPAIQVCLDTARSDPAKARALAEEWVSRTEGPQRAAGRHCLGVAAGNAGDWGAAASAFLAARDDASEAGFRARMSALAASAFLADEQPAEALAAIEGVDAAGDTALAGTIAIEKAAV